MRFSVVVNTYNRAQSLELTLEGLRWLDHDDFEVVVVNGPSVDSTDELLARYGGRVKVVDCPERNLSASRNLGIAAAAGTVVAFIDDDAYPHPGWLTALERAFE
ncbi:MAG: glycosyltransferase, partial [Actinomycetota bacterium]|nr:glycosyltransferase [Actinomycetota bacterium]